MDSKKKPFWLEWTNEDEKGGNIELIFKCGDGRYILSDSFVLAI